MSEHLAGRNGWVWRHGRSVANGRWPPGRPGGERSLATLPSVDRLLAIDHAVTREVNAIVRRSPTATRLVSASATGLAGFEIACMLLLALTGRWKAAARMLLAVATVYGFVEGVGRVWRRQRPFARWTGVEELVEHEAHRSFPSRHVASAVAMASLGGEASPALGSLMALAAAGLGAARVAAGVHYPSDAAAGAFLGVLVGRLFRGR